MANVLIDGLKEAVDYYRLPAGSKERDSFVIGRIVDGFGSSLIVKFSKVRALIADGDVEGTVALLEKALIELIENNNSEPLTTVFKAIANITRGSPKEKIVISALHLLSRKYVIFTDNLSSQIGSILKQLDSKKRS